MTDQNFSERFAELTRRVDMLEQDNRRLRRRNRLGRMVTLIACAAVVFGAVVAAAPDKNLVTGKPSTGTHVEAVVPIVPETPIPREETGLRAQKIVIVNQQGKVGAVLQGNIKGGATLTIFDQQGNPIWRAPNPIGRAMPIQ